MTSCIAHVDEAPPAGDRRSGPELPPAHRPRIRPGPRQAPATSGTRPAAASWRWRPTPLDGDLASRNPSGGRDRRTSSSRTVHRRPGPRPAGPGSLTATVARADRGRCTLRRPGPRAIGQPRRARSWGHSRPKDVPGAADAARGGGPPVPLDDRRSRPGGGRRGPRRVRFRRTPGPPESARVTWARLRGPAPGRLAAGGTSLAVYRKADASREPAVGEPGGVTAAQPAGLRPRPDRRISSGGDSGCPPARG